MKFDAIQLMRVADEITKYFYIKGARNFRVSYAFDDERSSCAIVAKGFRLCEDDEHFVRRVFSGPVQPEIANYYGSLAGRRRDDPEMELVGTMVELDEFISSEADGTRMVVSRGMPSRKR